VAVSGSVGRAIGLDVHRDFCEVAICEAGRVRSAGQVKTSPEVLELFAQSLGREDRVASEVTGNAWEIARILEGHVRRVVVVSPEETGIGQARAKTDRLDARTLARLLWAGELDAVWMPDEDCRVMRRRLARREQLVRSRTRAKNEIHAVLMRRLQGKPPMSDLFGARGRRWLRALELPPEEDETIESALRHVEFLDSEIAAVERLIARAALGSGHARRLVDRAGRERDLRGDGAGRGRRHPPLPLVGGAGWLSRPGSTRAPVRQRARQGGPDPPSADQARRAGCWSKRPGQSSSNPVRCTPSTSASALAAVTARRSSRSRASLRSCSGACSRAARTTPTSNPH
jgi:hypothetical protein